MWGEEGGVLDVHFICAIGGGGTCTVLYLIILRVYCIRIYAVRSMCVHLASTHKIRGQAQGTDAVIICVQILEYAYSLFVQQYSLFR